MLVAAALLLIVPVGNAVAADKGSEQSRRTEKLLAELNSAGINNRDIQDFITDMDAKVDGHFFTLTETQLPEADAKVSIRYRLNSPRKVELAVTPNNSHFEAVARTDSVMLIYHFEIPVK